MQIKRVFLTPLCLLQTQLPRSYLLFGIYAFVTSFLTAAQTAVFLDLLVLETTEELPFGDLVLAQNHM